MMLSQEVETDISSVCRQTSPSFYDVAHLFVNESQAIDYLDSRSIFYKQFSCPDCGENMIRNIPKIVFRCPRHTCRRRLNMRIGTFFYNSKLECSKILFMAWQWLHKSPSNSIAEMTLHSTATVAAFLDHFRQPVAASLQEDDSQIGGENIIVEIDESKFGKRKFNRGHRVEGVWIIGGIERTSESKVFLKVVENRSAETLLEVIRSHVAKGSIIHTDLWRGYANLKDEGFEHQTVNHSKSFKDPLIGTQTNTIEGLWNGLKLNIRPRNHVKESMDERLFEFIWRRKNKGNLWQAFINNLKEIHYDIE